MKIMLIVLFTLLLFSTGVCAESLEDRIKILEESLKKQEQTIQELRVLQQTLKEQERMINEQRKLIEELKAETKQSTSPSTPVPPVTAAQPWSLTKPITLAGAGANYLNISFDTLVDFGWSTTPQVATLLNLGDHDPEQRGFSLRNAEISMDGAVDPYFKAFGAIVFKLDENNETALEVEEAFAQTTSLPWNLQLKAGQFFTNFGRINPQHPHAWAFVDQPLVVNRMFGGDGLRNVGLQTSWLAPTPFYTELFLAVFNGEGGTSFSFRNPEQTFGRTPVERGLRGPGDLLFVPRLTSSFDLSDTQTLVLGASGAFGPNDTGTDTRTQIYGLDIYWKWRPISAQQGFPFVSWQTEGMYRRLQAGADEINLFPAETLKDYGFYSQFLYGFHLGWVAGLRGEFVTGNEGANDAIDPLSRADRTRISPNLTWYPTEFSKIRLQYNYDHGQAFGDEHSVWTQFEFMIGAHGAHKF